MFYCNENDIAPVYEMHVFTHSLSNRDTICTLLPPQFHLADNVYYDFQYEYNKMCYTKPWSITSQLDLLCNRIEHWSFIRHNSI